MSVKGTEFLKGLRSFKIQQLLWWRRWLCSSNEDSTFALVQELSSFMPRPRPISRGRIYSVSGRWPHILRFNKVSGDSQGLRGANLKIWGHCWARWNFFEIRPFEKGRSLVLPIPRGLEQSRFSGPSAVEAKFFPVIFANLSEHELPS